MSATAVLLAIWTPLWIVFSFFVGYWRGRQDVRRRAA